MALPKLPENHIWGTPKIDIIKGGAFSDPKEIEADVTLVIKHKPKWYVPARKVRTTKVRIIEGSTEGERIKKILQKAEEMVFSYQLDSHGVSA